MQTRIFILLIKFLIPSLCWSQEKSLFTDTLYKTRDSLVLTSIIPGEFGPIGNPDPMFFKEIKVRVGRNWLKTRDSLFFDTLGKNCFLVKQYHLVDKVPIILNNFFETDWPQLYPEKVRQSFSLDIGNVVITNRFRISEGKEQHGGYYIGKTADDEKSIILYTNSYFGEDKIELEEFGLKIELDAETKFISKIYIGPKFHKFISRSQRVLFSTIEILENGLRILVK